mmetsp:Transcript_1832/g.6030  ORF Transcript_1832/g.6030 Transcript_1832/m.6030 type:complete len:232 (-) Transcript_1832:1863-2558(-)
MNSVFIAVVASCSELLREPSSASTSSMNRMVGWSLYARVHMADIILFVSPYHLLRIVDALITMKHACDSFARALASIVFPVPGGPYSSTPRFCLRRDVRKCFGCNIGVMTLRCRSSMMSSRPPMSLSVQSMLSGLVISRATICSNSFSSSIFRPQRLAISFFCALVFARNELSFRVSAHRRMRNDPSREHPIYASSMTTDLFCMAVSMAIDAACFSTRPVSSQNFAPLGFV